MSLASQLLSIKHFSSSSELGQDSLENFKMSKPVEPEKLVLSGYKLTAKYGRQILAAFAANLGAFSFGTAWSYTATALPSMRQDPTSLVTNTDQESFITSVLFLGCILSSLISSFLIEMFGRRMTMLLANIPSLIGWVMIACATNVETIYAARFIIGITTACYGSASPLYVAETAHSNIRGRLVCTFDSMIAAGMVYINIIGSFTDWRMQAIYCGLIPIIAFATLILVPESPYFLYQKDNKEAAEKGLVWLNPSYSKTQIQEELTKLSDSCEQDKQDKKNYGWRVILESNVFKPILIGSMLMFFHQFCGNYPILAYGLSSFSSLGTMGSKFLGITLMNIAQFVASIIPIFFVDKLGRRPLLIMSELAMAITLSLLAVYFYLEQSTTLRMPWFPITSLVIYEIFYALGIGPLPFLLMGELVSPRMTGVSLGIITFVYRSLGFAQLFFFHDMSAALGQYGIYSMFALFCFMGAIFVYAFCPETSGMTLEAIHNPKKSQNNIESSRC